MRAARIMINLGLIGLAYYVGKQIGRTIQAKKELETWRNQQAISASHSEKNVDQEK